MTKPRKVIRGRKGLQEYIPLSLTQLWFHEKNDADFPKSFPITGTGRARGYYEDEVLAYQEKMASK